MKSRIRSAYFFVVTAAFFGPVALAHIWSTNETVHFKASGPDFGAPPLRYGIYSGGYTDVGGMSDWRPGTEYLDGERKTRNDVYLDFDPNYLYKKTNQLEAQGQYRSALKKWEWAKSKEIGDECVSNDRNWLLNAILDAKDRSHAIELLSATAPYGPKGKFPEESKFGKELRPYARYERIDHSKLNLRTKADGFLKLAKQFPNSPVAPVALLCVPDLLLGVTPDLVSAADINASANALHQLQTRYPSRAHRYQILGWQGRIQYVKKHFVDAIRTYRNQGQFAEDLKDKQDALNSIVLCYKRLGYRPAMVATLLDAYANESTGTGRAKYFNQVSLALGHINGNEAKDFWKRIRGNPRQLSSYLDFRQEMDQPSPDLISMATQRIDKAINSPYGGHILARIAEAAYVLEKTGYAKKMAERALSLSRTDDDRALATYLLASIAKRQDDWKGAQVSYEAVLKNYPTNYLAGGTRENLALIYERQNRFDKALEMYWKLNYPYDVAYLIDIRMSTAQLAETIKNPRYSDHSKLLRFSLAMRYLRDEQFHLAAEELRTLSAKTRENFRRQLYENEVEEKGTNTDLIQDPLQTAQELGTLAVQFRAAKTPNEKAVVKWKTANYYYTHRNLLLYNPAVWHMARSLAIGFQWNASIATRQDFQAIERHHWEHECYARTLTLCKEILKAYPKSPLRFEVAYRAACAAEKLSHMNRYWRWQARQKDLMGQAVNLMAIARKSPEKELAKKAKKYARVFAESRESQLQAFQEMDTERKKEFKKGQPETDWTWY